MSRSLLSLLAVLVLFPRVALLADDASDQATVAQVEKDLAKALIAGDVKALGELFAPEWKLVGADGVVMARDELFKAIKGQLKFTSYEPGDLDIRIYKDTAIVIGSGHGVGSFKDEAFDTHERFTDVLVRQEGKWRFVSSHSSDLAQ